MGKVSNTGTVLYSIPEIGIVQVKTSDGAKGISISSLAAMPYSTATYGVTQNMPYAAGSGVTMSITGDENLNIISGPANNSTKDPGTDIKGGNMYYLSGNIPSSKYTFTAKFVNNKTSSLDKIKIENRSANCKLDVAPGDYDLSEVSTNIGLHIGRDILTVFASPLAFIDASDITNKIRIVGEALESHTITTEMVHTTKYSARNVAANVYTAYGILENKPIIQKDTKSGRYSVIEEAAVPLYFIQHVDGGIIRGEEYTILGMPTEEGSPTPVKLHSDMTEPPILYKRRISAQGDTVQASALAIRNIKTPDIRAICQVAYGELIENKPLVGDDMIEATTQDDLRVPIAKDSMDIEDIPDSGNAATIEDQIDDAPINQLSLKAITKDYIKQCLEELAEEGFCIGNKEATIQNKISNNLADIYKNISGPTSAQGYPAPKKIELTAQDGTKCEYFGTTSFITHEPDGSLLIKDGYGSEIRMSRGNIIISPALDLIFRPGRDMAAMVPRHLALNTQDTLTLNSTGVMYIRSVTDLKLTGGTGEAGGNISIDCKSAIPGTGVTIQSGANMTVRGNDVLITRAKASNREAGVESPDRAGSIIIDACGNGSIFTYGSSSTENVLVEKTIAVGASTHSVINITQWASRVYLKNILVSANIEIKSPRSGDSIMVYEPGGFREVSIDFNRSDYFVDLAGNIRVFGAGQIKTIASESEVAVVSSNSVSEVWPSKDETSTVYEKSAVISTQVSKITESAERYIWNSSKLLEAEFYFQEDFGIPKEYKMPGMSWQIDTDTYHGGNQKYKWKEQYIKNDKNRDTACYPGISIWESARITGPGYTYTGTLKEAYTTNRP